MDNSSLLEQRDLLTQQLLERPCSTFTYIERAWCYEELGYPDLGTGDAYRALLLTDEISDDSGEYHEEALEAFCEDVKSRLGDESSLKFGTHFFIAQDEHVDTDHRILPGPREAIFDECEDSTFLLSTVDQQRLNCFALLSRLLSQIGCLRSAYDFMERGLAAAPSKDMEFIQRRREITKKYNTILLEKDPNWNDWNWNPKTDLPEQGHARRELYPWNRHEPDRFSEENLSILNERLKTIAPKCEVRITSLPVLSKPQPSPTNHPQNPAIIKQLGLFATQDISPGEVFLQETSLLTANNRLHDPLCDACSAPLRPSTSLTSPLPSCPECEDIIFCSPTCHSLATRLYHQAVCGKPDLDALAKDPSPLAATNALYLLLLGRVFAMSETQGVHPLDLAETKFLWGDFSSPPPHHDEDGGKGKTLPWTFTQNILRPHHLLQKFDTLNNIFTALPTTEPWVLATLLAKFHGVASARMDERTGIPEVCAVHPMWCLANHSCAPNVRWEWGGEIRFWARGGGEGVRWGGGGGGEGGEGEGEGMGMGEGGIKKGEEVLNHYCDVGLGVRERREWAAGPLGGVCMCERCVWEDGEEKRKEGLGGDV